MKPPHVPSARQSPISFPSYLSKIPSVASAFSASPSYYWATEPPQIAESNFPPLYLYLLSLNSNFYIQAAKKARQIRRKGLKISTRLELLMKIFDIRRFWTFTFFPDIPENERMKYWNKFITALRKHYPELKYFLMKEEHKSGKIHLHCLFDLYVPWHVAYRLWQKCGAGKVLHVKVLDKSGAGRYICKYLVKGIRTIKGRVFSCSRKFTLHLSNFPKWCLKVASLGKEKYLFFLLDSFDWETYTMVVGEKKRKLMSEVWQIAILLGG